MNASSSGLETNSAIVCMPSPRAIRTTASASAVIAMIATAAQRRPERIPNSAATSVTATMNASPSATWGIGAITRAMQTPPIRTPARTRTEARPAP